jgi:hypothetical protein
MSTQIIPEILENGKEIEPTHVTSNKSRIDSIYLRFLRSSAVQTVLAIALVATLFLGDLWTIGNPTNSDDGIFNAICLVFFVVFIVEIIIS